MWIRSSTESLPTRPDTAPGWSGRRYQLVPALLLIFGMVTAGMGTDGVWAQTEPTPADDIARPTFDPPESYRASEVDPVTLAVMADALLRLQFLAVAALESDEDVGLAQSGVVRAYLARGQMERAVEIARRITDTVWRARSFIWISDYTKIVLKDPVMARDWLDQAVVEWQTLDVTPDTVREGDTILHEVATRLAELGLPQAAMQTAQRIPDRAARVRALREVASLTLARQDDAATRQEVALVLRETLEEARRLEISVFERAGILMDIGAALLAADDVASAQQAFTIAQRDIVDGPSDGRLEALTMLAARMVEAGNQRGGMAVVRLIPEGADRARALAAVSGALGRRNIDAAVPLFLLAMEEAERVEDQSLRFDVITFLVSQQTQVGRLKDAFEGAFKITEDVPRAAALLDMGRVLISQGKLAEALVLKEYIPYVGMRAQVMAPVAFGRGLEEDPEGASALLAEALDPTGWPSLPDYVPDALDLVLRTQIRVGLESADQAIFSRARDLTDVLPGDIARVQALVQIAIAEARRGRIEDAQKTISAAYRIAFEHRDAPGFNSALLSISLAQLAAGDLLGAYDTAARIPEPPEDTALPRTVDGGFAVPRYQALIRVAAAAGRLGDPNFGQEVTDKIGHDPAKAIGLAAVAIAMSNQTSDLIDVINDIRDGGLLSPNFEALDVVHGIDAVPSTPAAPTLPVAPSLTPLPSGASDG